MEEKFLNYDIPNFVKESHNYLKLFEKERIILKNKHDKWGIYFSEELGYSLEYKENLGKVDYVYDSFLEAYSQADNDGEVWFSDEIAHEVFGEPEDEDLNEKGEFGNLSDDFFWTKNHLIFRHHGDYSVKNLEDEYQEWKNLDKKVKEDSFTHENFLLIYEWLRTHPNFWKENVHGNRVFWETSHMNLNFMDIYPTSSETSGKVEWWAEGGYHVLDDTDVPYATTYYHDIALDCGGNTYEQAVLNFAKNVWLQTHGMLKDKEARRDAIFERWVKDSGCESD